MGVALEFSKLVATSWLYRNWKETAFLMKTYMLAAILVLMVITSMGIFGFLSRSHLESSAFSAETVDNQIALIDSRIQSRQTYLNRIQVQIDSIDESFNRYVELGSISRGITERQNFKQERDALEVERKEIDNEILKLQEERAVVLNEKNKIQVEIGPLRYIAELIYPGEAEKHFESAVRWVILLIVVVFDPLAIVLLLAANKSMMSKVKPVVRREVIREQPVKAVEVEPEYIQPEKTTEPVEEIVEEVRESSQEPEIQDEAPTNYQYAKPVQNVDDGYSKDPLIRRYQMSLQSFGKRFRKGV
jgi:hypothetical protein